MARLRPSPVRSRINSRSNSAMAASSVESSRPCGLDVSHNGSPSDRNAAPALLMRSMTSSSSRVDLPSRSSLVTVTISPGFNAAMSLASCGRSARTPLTFSRKIVSAPAALSASIWPLKSWSIVLTRAYPRTAIALSIAQVRFATYNPLEVLVQRCSAGAPALLAGEEVSHERPEHRDGKEAEHADPDEENARHDHGRNA